MSSKLSNYLHTLIISSVSARSRQDLGPSHCFWLHPILIWVYSEYQMIVWLSLIHILNLDIQLNWSQTSKWIHLRFWKSTRIKTHFWSDVNVILDSFLLFRETQWMSRKLPADGSWLWRRRIVCSLCQKKVNQVKSGETGASYKLEAAAVPWQAVSCDQVNINTIHYFRF